MTGVFWQRVEGALVFTAALGAYVYYSDIGLAPVWWLALLFFFAPDLAFFGYLVGPRVGAVAYNAVHLYGPGMILAVAGLAGVLPATVIAYGLLWAGHAGFDRMFGYGLKLPSGFNDTHLGSIGGKEKR